MRNEFFILSLTLFSMSAFAEKKIYQINTDQKLIESLQHNKKMIEKTDQKSRLNIRIFVTPSEDLGINEKRIIVHFEQNEFNESFTFLTDVEISKIKKVTINERKKEIVIFAIHEQVDQTYKTDEVLQKPIKLKFSYTFDENGKIINLVKYYSKHRKLVAI